MYVEIRNDYHFGPLYENGAIGDDGILAGVSIDGWISTADDAEGAVIAQVLLSEHGDILVAWHDNGARMSENVLSAIEEAKSELRRAYSDKGFAAWFS